MSFKKQNNDRKGLLLLTLFGLPLIASTNIDCSGKAFHCVDSTHFMICVDLGPGVLQTVDDNVIPCPPPTVCQRTNRFECEFPISSTLSPTLGHSDTTVDMAINVTTPPWEEIVTTIFPTKQNEAELSDLKYFNTVVSTTLPETIVTAKSIEPITSGITKSNETITQTLEVSTESTIWNETAAYVPETITTLVYGAETFTENIKNFTGINFYETTNIEKNKTKSNYTYNLTENKTNPVDVYDMSATPITEISMPNTESMSNSVNGIETYTSKAATLVNESIAAINTTDQAEITIINETAAINVSTSDITTTTSSDLLNYQNDKNVSNTVMLFTTSTSASGFEQTTDVITPVSNDLRDVQTNMLPDTTNQILMTPFSNIPSSSPEIATITNLESSTPTQSINITTDAVTMPTNPNKNLETSSITVLFSSSAPVETSQDITTSKNTVSDKATGPNSISLPTATLVDKTVFNGTMLSTKLSNITTEAETMPAYPHYNVETSPVTAIFLPTAPVETRQYTRTTENTISDIGISTKSISLSTASPVEKTVINGTTSSTPLSNITTETKAMPAYSHYKVETPPVTEKFSLTTPVETREYITTRENTVSDKSSSTKSISLSSVENTVINGTMSPTLFINIKTEAETMPEYPHYKLEMSSVTENFSPTAPVEARQYITTTENTVSDIATNTKSISLPTVRSVEKNVINGTMSSTILSNIMTEAETMPAYSHYELEMSSVTENFSPTAPVKTTQYITTTGNTVSDIAIGSRSLSLPTTSSVEKSVTYGTISSTPLSNILTEAETIPSYPYYKLNMSSVTEKFLPTAPVKTTQEITMGSSVSNFDTGTNEISPPTVTSINKEIINATVEGYFITTNAYNVKEFTTSSTDTIKNKPISDLSWMETISPTKYIATTNALIVNENTTSEVTTIAKNYDTATKPSNGEVFAIATSEATITIISDLHLYEGVSTMPSPITSNTSTLQDTASTSETTAVINKTEIKMSTTNHVTSNNNSDEFSTSKSRLDGINTTLVSNQKAKTKEINYENTTDVIIGTTSETPFITTAEFSTPQSSTSVSDTYNKEFFRSTSATKSTLLSNRNSQMLETEASLSTNGKSSTRLLVNMSQNLTDTTDKRNLTQSSSTNEPNITITTQQPIILEVTTNAIPTNLNKSDFSNINLRGNKSIARNDTDGLSMTNIDTTLAYEISGFPTKDISVTNMGNEYISTDVYSTFATRTNTEVNNTEVGEITKTEKLDTHSFGRTSTEKTSTVQTETSISILADGFNKVEDNVIIVNNNTAETLIVFDLSTYFNTSVSSPESKTMTNQDLTLQKTSQPKMIETKSKIIPHVSQNRKENSSGVTSVDNISSTNTMPGIVYPNDIYDFITASMESSNVVTESTVSYIGADTIIQTPTAFVAKTDPTVTIESYLNTNFSNGNEFSNSFSNISSIKIKTNLNISKEVSPPNTEGKTNDSTVSKIWGKSPNLTADFIPEISKRENFTGDNTVISKLNARESSEGRRIITEDTFVSTITALFVGDSATSPNDYLIRPIKSDSVQAINKTGNKFPNSLETKMSISTLHAEPIDAKIFKTENATTKFVPHEMHTISDIAHLVRPVENNRINQINTESLITTSAGTPNMQEIETARKRQEQTQSTTVIYSENTMYRSNMENNKQNIGTTLSTPIHQVGTEKNKVNSFRTAGKDQSTSNFFNLTDDIKNSVSGPGISLITPAISLLTSSKHDYTNNFLTSSAITHTTLPDATVFKGQTNVQDYKFKTKSHVPSTSKSVHNEDSITAKNYAVSNLAENAAEGSQTIKTFSLDQSFKEHNIAKNPSVMGDNIITTEIVSDSSRTNNFIESKVGRNLLDDTSETVKLDFKRVKFTDNADEMRRKLSQPDIISSSSPEKKKVNRFNTLTSPYAVNIATKSEFTLQTDVTTEKSVLNTNNQITIVQTTPRLIIRSTTPKNNIRAVDNKLDKVDNETNLSMKQPIFDCKNRISGRYADNDDCRKFYVCSGIYQPIIGLCPNKTVFSEIKKLCTRNLSHCIRHNQFKCVIEGRFSDFLKQNIFYICVRNSLGDFVRFKLQCQNGYHLNKTTVRCSQDLEPFNQSSSSIDSKSTVEKKSKENKKTEVKKAESKEFECEKEGKFADPQNCRKYYVCSKHRKSDEFRVRRKKCDSDEIFHKDKKKCVDSDSYECKS